MLITSNLTVSFLIALYFNLNFIFAFLLGIFVYFFLNLIPHYVFSFKKNLLYWVINIIDIIISSFIFVLSFVSTIDVLDLGRFFGINHQIFINYESWFILLSNTLVSGIFFILENFFSKDKFASNIIHLKKNFEFVDNTFWGIFIHISIPLLGFLVMFGFLDLSMFFRVFL